MFLAVRGNCDFGSDLPLTGEFTAQGVKIFYTHGHYYGVKSGLYTLACAARERGAQVALYGHTHNALEDYDDGLYPVSYTHLDVYKRQRFGRSSAAAARSSRRFAPSAK